MIASAAARDRSTAKKLVAGAAAASASSTSPRPGPTSSSTRRSFPKTAAQDTASSEPAQGVQRLRDVLRRLELRVEDAAHDAGAIDHERDASREHAERRRH